MTKDAKQPHTRKPYSELVGMVQWVANETHLDIQFSINLLSWFLSRPTDYHWNAAVHFLTYPTQPVFTFVSWYPKFKRNPRLFQCESGSDCLRQTFNDGPDFQIQRQSHQLEIKETIYAGSVYDQRWIHGHVGCPKESNVVVWLYWRSQWLQSEYNSLLQRSRCRIFVNKWRVTLTNPKHQFQAAFCSWFFIFCKQWHHI